MVEGGELPEKYYSEKEHVIIGGVDCLVSRTGYTGEFGYEIFCPAEQVGLIWDLLLEKGGQDILPCGLGAGIPFGWKRPCLFTAMKWMRP